MPRDNRIDGNRLSGQRRLPHFDSIKSSMVAIFPNGSKISSASRSNSIGAKMGFSIYALTAASRMNGSTFLIERLDKGAGAADRLALVPLELHAADQMAHRP